MQALRLPRAARLLRPADFAALRAAGQSLFGRHFILAYRVNTNGVPRLGMAVSRRVSKRAVVRNRIRRVSRESFRLIRPTLPACDIMLVARPSAAPSENTALRSDLESLWCKLAALNRTQAPGTMRADN